MLMLWLRFVSGLIIFSSTLILFSFVFDYSNKLNTRYFFSVFQMKTFYTLGILNSIFEIT